MTVGTYHVSLSSFEGPFDLLLHLIARRRLDVYEIPIAQITDDYLAVLEQMETVDLEVATEFLVVAATLIELKAARLLPDTDDPELDELALEARDLLYARLLDYRVFKEAAGWVRGRLDGHAGHWPRGAPMEERFARLRPPVIVPVSAQELAAIAGRALAERPEEHVDLSHVQPIRLTVEEAADIVVAALGRAGGRASFRELTAGCRHRVEVVVHFLAVLELYKLEMVELEQARNFGDLMVVDADAAPVSASKNGLGELRVAE
ncbi:MAG: segregation/condensation protein A [Nitriliruptorales bacterium]|nr:segregation/condensation protein A [Nitriliruptorales bacterium]